MAPQVLSLTMPASLEEAKVEGIPQSAFYISDFITQEEEQALLNKVRTLLAIRFYY